MASKLRRQQDIITNNIESLKNATKTYANYFNGESPVTITYYQINDVASKYDSSLENVHEIIGTNSPRKYNRIRNVVVYGITSLDLLTNLSEGGLTTSISGEFVMIPDINIRPRGGEFFTIQDEIHPELEQHLFRIKDVQFDRATSDKFYKCTYELYPEDADLIYRQVIKKYIYQPGNNTGNRDGVGDSVLITEEEAQSKGQLQALVDSLIDRYQELFFNVGMDTFTYEKALNRDGTEFEYYWCPYVNHFIYKNNVMEKSDQEFLTEIYVQDINETEYPMVYREDGYRKSLFYAIEVQDTRVMDNTNSSFLQLSPYDLSKPLNLPFFSSADNHILVDVMHKYNLGFYLNAFHFILSDEDHLSINSPEEYKFIDGEEDDIQNREGIIKPNRLLYRVDENNKAIVKDVYWIDETGEIDDVGIINLFESKKDYHGIDMTLINIIRPYIKGESISIDKNLLANLNEYYYENNMMTFILLPIVIYILQQKI